MRESVVEAQTNNGQLQLDKQLAHSLQCCLRERRTTRSAWMDKQRCSMGEGEGTRKGVTCRIKRDWPTCTFTRWKHRSHSPCPTHHPRALQECDGLKAAVHALPHDHLADGDTHH